MKRKWFFMIRNILWRIKMSILWMYYIWWQCFIFGALKVWIANACLLLHDFSTSCLFVLCASRLAVIPWKFHSFWSNEQKMVLQNVWNMIWMLCICDNNGSIEYWALNQCPSEWNELADFSKWMNGGYVEKDECSLSVFSMVFVSIC